MKKQQEQTAKVAASGGDLKDVVKALQQRADQSEARTNDAIKERDALKNALVRRNTVDGLDYIWIPPGEFFRINFSYALRVTSVWPNCLAHDE